MAQAILITDSDFTSEKLNARIEESVEDYAKSRSVMRKDINIDEIREAVVRISQAKIFDELNVKYTTTNAGVEFLIHLVEPSTADESGRIINGRDPHITFTQEGNYLTVGAKNDESYSIPEKLLSFFNELLAQYLRSATFIAVASIGLRT